MGMGKDINTYYIGKVGVASRQSDKLPSDLT